MLKSIKKKLIKLFLILSVCLSLTSGPVVGNEVIKMLETLSGVKDEMMKEHDTNENENGEQIAKEK
ncbi:MAG: hypothetical protein K0S47_2083 [Herbinix sp.]|nr:hypothetical protein [Herbinix sp.]